jgi:hypothetical protein
MTFTRRQKKNLRSKLWKECESVLKKAIERDDPNMDPVQGQHVEAPQHSSSEIVNSAHQVLYPMMYPASPPPQPPPYPYQNMQVSLMDINRKLDFVSSKMARIDDIDSALQNLTIKVSQLEAHMGAMGQRSECIEHGVEQVKVEVTGVRRENAALREDLDDLTVRSMRDNLLFFGIPELPDEDPSKVVVDFIKTTLEITDASDIKLDRVHRMGRRKHGTHRALVAKFNYYPDRERVRGAREKLRQTSFGIAEQLPTGVYIARRRHMDSFKSAKERGKHAMWRGKNLYVEGQQVPVHDHNSAFHQGRQPQYDERYRQVPVHGNNAFHQGRQPQYDEQNRQVPVHGNNAFNQGRQHQDAGLIPDRRPMGDNLMEGQEQHRPTN